LLALKISTSSLVTNTELKFCPGAGCKKNVYDFVFHVVKCIVNAEVKSFWAPELSRILMRSDHSRLPLIKSIELKPVFFSAQLHLNREDKSIVGTAGDDILCDPLCIVIKFCIGLCIEIGD